MWTWSSWLAFLPTTMISYLCDFCVISCISHFYWSRALRNSSFIFFVCPRIIFRTTRHCLLAWGWWSTSSSFALQHSFFPITFVPMKGSVYLWNQQAINSKYLKLLILITTLRGEKQSSILWCKLLLMFWIPWLIWFSPMSCYSRTSKEISLD